MKKVVNKKDAEPRTKIEKRMRELGLNDRTLAQTLGVTSPYVCQLRIGVRSPKGWELLARLCDALKCEVSDIVEA